jgi:hypothetical protein
MTRSQAARPPAFACMLRSIRAAASSSATEPRRCSVPCSCPTLPLSMPSYIPSNESATSRGTPTCARAAARLGRNECRLHMATEHLGEGGRDIVSTTSRLSLREGPSTSRFALRSGRRVGRSHLAPENSAEHCRFPTRSFVVTMRGQKGPTQTRRQTMRVMVFVKATEDSGKAPPPTPERSRRWTRDGERGKGQAAAARL